MMYHGKAGGVCYGKREEHGWRDDDSDADYTWILVTSAEGKQTPYLKDPLLGGRLPKLDNTTYMDTSAHHVSDKSSIDLDMFLKCLSPELVSDQSMVSQTSA